MSKHQVALKIGMSAAGMVLGAYMMKFLKSKGWL